MTCRDNWDIICRENLAFINELKSEAEIQKAVEDYQDYYDVKRKKFSLFFTSSDIYNALTSEGEYGNEKSTLKRISAIECYKQFHYFKLFLDLFKSNELTVFFGKERLNSYGERLFSEGLGIPNSTYKKIEDNFDKISQDFTSIEIDFLKETLFEKRAHFLNVFKESRILRYSIVRLFIQKVFKFLGYNELIYIIEENIKHLKYHFSNNTSFTEKPAFLKNITINEIFKFQTLDTLKNAWGLNENEIKYLQITFFELFTECIYSITSTLDIHRSTDLFSISLQQLFGIPNNEFIRIAGSKKLKNLGLTEDIVPSYIIRISDTHQYALNELFYNIQDFEQTYCRAMTDEEVLSMKFEGFQVSDLDNALPLSSFSYLGADLENLKKMLLNKSRNDVLIWGNPGYGKTEVVRSLVKETNNKLLDLNEIIENESIADHNSRLKKMIEFKYLVKQSQDFVLLVDEAEDIIHDKQFKNWVNSNIGKHDITTFWILNDIKDIHPSYLRRFDYIMEINHMCFDKRLELAKDFLGNNDIDNLSYKISQAIHTPAEIISAINWAKNTNDYSWNNISHKINGYQKLISKSNSTENGNFEIKVIQPSQSLTIDDFAGYQYIKDEAQEFLDIFKNPEKYKHLNAKIPKGVLFAGSPGVGKTLFAKCLSSYVNTNLITANSSELAANPKLIKTVFDKAKSIAPCIVFLDEIDVLGSNVVNPDGSIDTKKQEILNQLLIEMDGFEKYSGILVLGATHRSNLLDASLRRSGRFGKTIFFREPSKDDRQEIYKHYVKGIVAEKNIDYQFLARISGGFTSADIAEAVNEAALIAARKNHKKVTQEDLIKATDKIYFGTTMNGFPMTEVEKFRTAVHESGHALVSVLCGKTVQRATIKPHENFLGMVQTEAVEGDYGWSMASIKDQIKILLAGMIAEKVVLGNFKSGNSSDLNYANNILNVAFEKYGMSDTLSVFSPNSHRSNGLLSKIEKEKCEILNEAFTFVEKWLKDNKIHLLNFAKLLLQDRYLDVEQIQEWFDENIEFKNENIIFSSNLSAEEMIEAARTFK